MFDHVHTFTLTLENLDEVILLALFTRIVSHRGVVH